MIKIVLVFTLLVTAQLYAVVQTKNAKSTNKVYLGSFLAQGHLPANNIYKIDAPVEGIVQSLRVNIHDSIKKGAPLLVIKSPQLLELEATYIDTLIEKEYFQKEVARLKPLFKNAVVAKKVYFKATNNLSKFQAQSKFYFNLLVEWGLTKRQVERITKTKKPITNITLYAPVSGKVSDLVVYPKMYANRGEPLMTVVDAKDVHLEVSLPLGIAKSLVVNTKLYIDNMPVHVESIAAQIDTRTQTLAVHLVSEKSMNLIPQEKLKVRLFLPKKAFELPSSAVFRYANQEAVFVKTSNGFELLQVNLLSRNSKKVYVSSSKLSEDSKIAVTGVIALKGTLEAHEND